MPDYMKIVALQQRLTAERRRIVLAAAESGTLPPARFLSHLADLDGAVLAVEAVLDEGESRDRPVGNKTSATLN